MLLIEYGKTTRKIIGPLFQNYILPFSFGYSVSKWMYGATYSWGKPILRNPNLTSGDNDANMRKMVSEFNPKNKLIIQDWHIDTSNHDF